MMLVMEVRMKASNHASHDSGIVDDENDGCGDDCDDSGDVDDDGGGVADSDGDGGVADDDGGKDDACDDVLDYDGVHDDGG